MKFERTPISGLSIVESAVKGDSRGTFSRLFCADSLEDLLGDRRIVQINHSYTRAAGSVRGLHYQRPPFAEMKFVRCLRGGVLDVAVDLRAGSSTFLQWWSEELTPDNHKMMIVPEGCAHGFQTLEADTELLYLHTQFYHPEAEAGVAPTDPRIGIRWPLEVTSISERDLSHPPLPPDFEGIRV